ncbi:p30-like movement protein [Diuris virus B]|uniref:p30-like movement protein n=1 Tax=Diuris virus B TaxID=1247116 RepID=K4P1H7_9VIRU|nr:p30-like movement protein [Diuris virus B]AFV57241.1 p30-like movement protein [Diuris virus B]
MQFTNSSKFIEKFDNGKRNIKCIKFEDVYNDGGYTKDQKVGPAMCSESSISIKSESGENQIIKGFSIVEANWIQNERNKGKYQRVNVGAIIISIHKLGYYEGEKNKGRCFLADGRRKGPTCIIKAFEFDISKGPAHFVLAPNAVFDINDELLTSACELFFQFDDVEYRAGSLPFAIEIGAIYRMCNVFNCHHTLGVPGRKGSVGSSYQEIHATKKLGQLDESKIYHEFEKAKVAGRVSSVGCDYDTTYEDGKRNLCSPWKKRGPLSFRKYSIEINGNGEIENFHQIRSDDVEVDERRVFENVLDSEVGFACKSSDREGNDWKVSEHGRGSESSSSGLGKFDSRIPGRSLWRKDQEVEEENAVKDSLANQIKGNISDSWAC